MYALSILPLLGVGYVRRLLPETRRWSSLKEREEPSAWAEGAMMDGEVFVLFWFGQFFFSRFSPKFLKDGEYCL